MSREHAAGGGTPGSACAPVPAAPFLDRDQAERLALALKALADPTRLQLLSLIRDSAGGRACVGDLTHAFPYSQPTISHHLRILMQAGFLERTRCGSWAWYSISSGQRDTVDQVLPERRDVEPA